MFHYHLFKETDTVVDIMAATMTAIAAAKKYPLHLLEKAMLERPEPVFTLAWLYAYENTVLYPEFCKRMKK